MAIPPTLNICRRESILKRDHIPWFRKESYNTGQQNWEALHSTDADII